MSYCKSGLLLLLLLLLFAQQHAGGEARVFHSGIVTDIVSTATTAPAAKPDLHPLLIASRDEEEGGGPRRLLLGHLFPSSGVRGVSWPQAAEEASC